MLAASQKSSKASMNSTPDEMHASPSLVDRIRRPGSGVRRQQSPGENGSAEGGERLAEDVPIDVYCDGKQLDVPARLRLFQQVCLLVHQAHQRGLIHGGLSARQILVAPEGTPRISSREPDDLATDAMVRPDDISPEQVLGEPATTATDIYGLGLVLYELLTGHQPYQVPGGEESEIYKAVCEQPPERPSLAVNRTDRANPDSSHQTSEIISAARGTTPRKLQRLLAGDLELIVLKALQKEPERRDGSADQFAEDIDRYFAGRPVRAHRDGSALPPEQAYPATPRDNRAGRSWLSPRSGLR